MPPSSPKPVLVVGELNVDLILLGRGARPEPGKEVLVDDALLTLGSASAICAMGLQKLGTDTSFLGLVGMDAWGEYCLATLREAGIDTTRVRAMTYSLESSPKYTSGRVTRRDTDEVGGMSLMNSAGKPSCVIWFTGPTTTP